jgi:hypothetical protein
MANKIFTSIQQDSIAGNVISSVFDRSRRVADCTPVRTVGDRYVDSTNCLHFMFKFRPLTSRKGGQAAGGGSNADASTPVPPLPTQYVQSAWRFPLDEPTINETYVLPLCRNVLLR